MLNSKILQFIIIGALVLISGYALLISVLSLMIYINAGASDCDTMRQSFYYCEPGRYLPQLIQWGTIFVISSVVTVLVNKALNGRKVEPPKNN